MPLKNDFISASLLDAIEALTKDKKFITWFRLTFPDFANQPAQVIAKYFFHQILAPLIVQLLLLLISGSFKDE